MDIKNLTESEYLPVTTFVPLFRDGENALGIHINAYERFGAWSFSMESDLGDYNSCVSELFTGLCRKAGIRRRLMCAIDLETGKREGDYEFLCIPSGALACGDYFTLESIHHLISTVFIPYWQLAARQINEFDRGNGLKDTCKRAEPVLGTWGEFDDVDSDDDRWEDAWASVNCGHDRRQLIQGDNWRIPPKDTPLERFSEHCSRKR